MKRRLFNAGAAVSLVLAIAVCILWARSYWVLDFGRVNGVIGAEFHSVAGGLSLGYGFPPDDAPYWEGGTVHGVPAVPIENLWFFSQRGDDFGGYSVLAPHWVFAALALLLPGIWLWKRPRRNPTGCPACGYDLRETPAWGGVKTCPECGAASAAGAGSGVKA